MNDRNCASKASPKPQKKPSELYAPLSPVGKKFIISPIRYCIKNTPPKVITFTAVITRQDNSFGKNLVKCA